jgi:hypothetical protein
MNYTIKTKNKKVKNLSKEDAKNWTAYFSWKNIAYKLKIN